MLLHVPVLGMFQYGFLLVGWRSRPTDIYLGCRCGPDATLVLEVSLHMLGIPRRVLHRLLGICICRVFCCVPCYLCVVYEDILDMLSKVLLVSQQCPAGGHLGPLRALRLWRLGHFRFLGSGEIVSVSSASSS